VEQALKPGVNVLVRHKMRLAFGDVHLAELTRPWVDVPEDLVVQVPLAVRIVCGRVARNVVVLIAGDPRGLLSASGQFLSAGKDRVHSVLVRNGAL